MDAEVRLRGTARALVSAIQAQLSGHGRIARKLGLLVAPSPSANSKSRLLWSSKHLVAQMSIPDFAALCH
jgi:hypothetical protein